jgi:hypothetical protein
VPDTVPAVLPAGPVPTLRVQLRMAAVVFGLLMVVLGSWAVATPLYAAQDEPPHVLRAAAVARGQILLKQAPGPPGTVWTLVEVPSVYGEMYSKVSCWVFRQEITPSCSGAFTGGHQLVSAQTYVGRYNPAYYAAVGLPERLMVGAGGVYAMRLTSAAISAAFLTLAVLAALRWRRPSVALLGLAVACTPMVLYLASVVNPNGVEAAAAICLWTAGLAALGRPPDAGDRGTLVLWATVAACVMAMTRGLSPLWVAVILGLVALAVVERPRTWLLGDRRTVVAGAAIAVSCLAAVAWLAVSDGVRQLPTPPMVDGSLAHAAKVILGGTAANVREMVGSFGWRDANPPLLTHLVWTIAVGALGLLGVSFGPARVRWAVAACTLATIVAPLLQLPTVVTAGLAWQGRYALPLAAGIPILAAYGLSSAGAELAAVLRRLGTVLAVLLGVALVTAFYFAARRYAVGLDGPITFLGHEDWQPPLPIALLLLTFVAGVAGLVTLFVRLTAREGRGADGPPRPAV